MQGLAIQCMKTTRFVIVDSTVTITNETHLGDRIGPSSTKVGWNKFVDGLAIDLDEVRVEAAR